MHAPSTYRAHLCRPPTSTEPSPNFALRFVARHPHYREYGFIGGRVTLMETDHKSLDPRRYMNLSPIVLRWSVGNDNSGHRIVRSAHICPRKSTESFDSSSWIPPKRGQLFE